MKYLLHLTTLLFFTSCKRNIDTASFSFPIILKQISKDTVSYFSAYSIVETWPQFVGKNKFGDTLKINSKIIGAEGKLNKEKLGGSELILLDSLKSDGFEVFPDYQSNVIKLNSCDDGKFRMKYYYPLYIVNRTPTTKIFTGKDQSVFAIQEAKDENNQWRPIEGKGWDGCGNGEFGLKVNQNEFVTVLIPKYSGNYKTLLRVRIRIGENLYITKSFWGEINKQQFYLTKDTTYIKSRHRLVLLKNNAQEVEYLFYGSIPLEIDKD